MKNEFTKDRQVPDMEVPDYACHAQQGDTQTRCKLPTRTARVVNAWDFVSCPVCKELHRHDMVRIGNVLPTFRRSRVSV